MKLTSESLSISMAQAITLPGAIRSQCFLKTRLLNLLLFCILISDCLHGQDTFPDKIITLSGDTIQAFIPADPRKETSFRKKVIGLVDDYGFSRLIAVFPNDSIRVYDPPDIKGYYRATPGKYIGSGWFESRSLKGSWIAASRKEGPNPMRFLHRVIAYDEVSFFMFRQSFGDAPPEYFYFLYFKNKTNPDIIYNYKQWKKWASENPPFDKISETLKKPNRKKYPFFKMIQDAGKAYKELQIKEAKQ